ncbi:RDD family protein [Rothia sp. LK2588]|uniref:RDD family protein n=1 Tax=Rothia sp. LK2588 TaxID=3114369 RepID=UPI0034CE73B0
MIERNDLPGWLSGAPTDQEYPGQHLGRPRTGPGSLARPMRRIVAFVFDWYLWWAVLSLVGLGGSSLAANVLLLVVVWAYQVLCVGFMGHTLGHLVCGMQVQSMDGRPAGWVSALVRSTLIMLVLPVIIMDADQRGLHDRARQTLLVRFR